MHNSCDASGNAPCIYSDDERFKAWRDGYKLNHADCAERGLAALRREMEATRCPKCGDGKDICQGLCQRQPVKGQL